MGTISFLSRTDTSRFDETGKKLWKEQGLILAHIQDRRLSSHDRRVMRDIASKLKYGERI